MSTQQIGLEIETVIDDFSLNAIDENLKKTTITDLTVDVVGNWVASLMPGLSQAKIINDALTKNADIDEALWKGFVAKTHLSLKRASRE